MNDINGKNIYFSNIGKSTYNNFRLNKYYNNNKNGIRNYLFKRNNNNFLDEEDKESFLNKDIFDISFKGNKSKKEIKKNDSNDSSLNDDTYKMNFKYHNIHLKRLKALQKLKIFKTNKDINDVMYDPNIDYIKKRIIIGPKWEYMTGRKEPKILDNNLIISNTKNNDNDFTDKKKEKNKNKIYSFFQISKDSKDKIKENDKDLFKKKLFKSTKINLKKKNLSTSFLSNTNKENKLKKLNSFSTKNISDISKEEKIMINFNSDLIKSKIYYLDNKIVNDSSIKRYIYPSLKNLKQHKKLKKINSELKIYKNKEIGLNNEELKIINDIKKRKKLNEINSCKKSIEKNKIKNLTDRKYKPFHNFYYIFQDNFLNKKTFNYYINKSLLNNKEHNKNINTLEYNKSFSHRIKSLNEFYRYDCDKINIYNYNKFDNITYKSLTLNK